MTGKATETARKDLYASRRRRLALTGRKVYLRIPGGEIQFGRVSRRVTVWFLGRRLI